MRQIILKDQHETTLEIIIVNIWLPKNLFVLYITQFVKWKKVRVQVSNEMVEKHNRGALKHVYDIVTGDELWIDAYESESN